MELDKIPVEIKTKWLEALRSDKYEQTTGTLHDNQNNAYCCLGVLCRINNLQVVPFASEKDYGTTFLYDGDMSEDDLPPAFRRAVNLSCDGEANLINMNDSGHTFKDIADFIEENY